MKHALLLFSLILCWATLSAQRDRYKFAQSYLGLQTDVIGGADSPELVSGRILLGGTHFWQQADFYLSFPLFNANLNEEAWDYSEGIITGFRYIPFGLSRKAPRPFVGVQWLTPSFRIGDGPNLEKSRWGVEAGLNWVFGSFYTLELSARHIFNQDVIYPISREATAPAQLPDFGLSIAVKKYIDTTAGNSSPEAQKYRKKRYEQFEEEGRLSTWSFGIGLSANISTSDLDFLRDYPFLPNRPPLNVYPDIVAGYYFHKQDAAVRASWRPMKQSDQAYGLDYSLRHHRFSLEAFKFLFDYKGFAPFLGLNIGYDYLNMELRDAEGNDISENYGTPSYGISFGWDIRTSETDPFILRTNLRYVIQSESESGEINLSGSHLEINFIQIVLYPSRWK